MAVPPGAHPCTRRPVVPARATAACCDAPSGAWSNAIFNTSGRTSEFDTVAYRRVGGRRSAECAGGSASMTKSTRSTRKWPTMPVSQLAFDRTNRVLRETPDLLRDTGDTAADEFEELVSCRYPARKPRCGPSPARVQNGAGPARGGAGLSNFTRAAARTDACLPLPRG
jgi:hypothetical protein